jgi:hypothetical protein
MVQKMDKDPLREYLVLHLTGMAAHVSFKAAMAGFPVELAGKRPRRLAHTAWGLVYHLWICQKDILEYALEAGHESPSYPSGLWPAGLGPADPAEWDRTIAAFDKDQRRIVKMLCDPERDLYAPMRDGLDETLLQMAGLVIDHNSYHIGQLVDLRMLLGVPVRDY